MIETISRVNKEISKSLGIPEDVVKAINKFYWSNIKSSIQSGEHVSVRIKNIGTLVISKVKLQNKISKQIRAIRIIRASNKTYISVTKEEHLEAHYNTLRLLLQRRNELATLFKTINDKHTKRRELSKKGLGEQITNTTGTSLEDIFL